jgi:hypothetical protein
MFVSTGAGLLLRGNEGLHTSTKAQTRFQSTVESATPSNSGYAGGMLVLAYVQPLQ